jgi:hypothetical protein
MGEPVSGERVGGDAFELRDVVETALVRALVLAAEGKRWELVAQIATELSERRKAREAGHAEPGRTITGNVEQRHRSGVPGRK